MATTLTSPVASPPVTHQGITSIQIRTPHRRSPDGLSVVLNRERVSVTYTVTTWNSQGQELEQKSRTVLLADWPGPFKTSTKSVYEKLEADAKANGLIGSGSDEAL